MRKSTRNLLVVGGLAGLFWYWIKKGKMPLEPDTSVAEATVLPTDSMLPGTMPMAISGIVMEDRTLKCVGGCR